MSVSKVFTDVVKALPSVTTTSGLRFLCFDAAQGILKLLPWESLISLLRDDNRVMVKNALPKGDLDANNLTSPMTLYTSSSDMSSWGDTAFVNFPVSSKPAGGFILMCLPESQYMKQIYFHYGGTTMYIRMLSYNGSNGTKVWSAWKKFTPVDL